MKLIIDTSVDSAEQLRKAADFLNSLAGSQASAPSSSFASPSPAASDAFANMFGEASSLVVPVSSSQEISAGSVPLKEPKVELY